MSMFEFEPITPRLAAKYVVTAAVQDRVRKIAKNAITDYLGFDDDNTVVGIAGQLVGWTVASQLKPHTDKLVDKTADFVAAKRAERAEKNKQKEQTTE